MCDLKAAERFFVDLLGYRVEWRPGEDDVYLAGHGDNIALHRVPERAGPGQLDHLGLAVARAEEVDAWASYLGAQGAELVSAPRTHRDGARSLYLRGPEGLTVQIIHHEPLLGR